MPAKTVSRRVVARGIGLGLASMVFRASGQQAAGRRVLALVGDRYHNSDYIRVALTRMFEGQGVTVDYTVNYERLSAELLKGYQLFVSLRDGMIWPQGYLGPDAYSYEQGLENKEDFPDAKSQNWLREEQAVALKEFVEAGNGFYSMHNNSHVSLSSKTWRDVQGGAYIGHPPLRPFRVRVVNANHPITRGIQDFFVNDEQHYVAYDKDKKNILLEAENVDGLAYGTLGTQQNLFAGGVSRRRSGHS